MGLLMTWEWTTFLYALLKWNTYIEICLVKNTVPYNSIQFSVYKNHCERILEYHANWNHEERKNVSSHLFLPWSIDCFSLYTKENHQFQWHQSCILNINNPFLFSCLVHRQILIPLPSCSVLLYYSMKL